MPVGKDDIKISSLKQFDSYTVNRYTKCDPTLPRSLKMSCPNQECSSAKDESGKSNIVYIRHNDVDMKYTYMCCNCDMSWNMEV